MNLEERKKQLYEQLKLRRWGNMSKEERKEQSRRELKAHLQYIDLLKLQRKIDNFRKLNFRNLSYQEVGNAVNDVILYETPKGKSYILPFSGCPSYPAGTRFYRVRAIPKDWESLTEKIQADNLSNALLKNRNESWVEKMLLASENQDKAIFVTGGTAHFIGPDNVLSLLQR